MRIIDFAKLEKVLLGCLLEGCDIQELYRRVHECLGLPVICFDTTFHLVAYAFPRPFYYVYWEEIAENGRASESNILGNNFLDYQEMMYKHGRSLYFDSGTCVGFPQACGPVMVDGRLAAYSGIMIEDGIKEEALRANDLLSRTAASILRDSAEELAREAAERILAQDRCSPEDASRIEAELPPPWVFVIFRGKRLGVSTLEYVRGMLCSRGGGGAGCLSGPEELYILQSGLNGGKRSGQLMDTFDSLARLYGLECGISDTFSSLAELPERRTQAQLALRAEGDKRVRSFSGFYPQIVARCALDYFGPQASRLSCLEALAAADTDGELLRTLELYLRSFRRPALVAQELGLHRNTVVNRIRRIEELLGLDLGDTGYDSAILMALDVLRSAAGMGEV